MIRLRNRMLDLRREGMQEAMILRHTVNRAIRDYLNSNDFLEIETPILTRSTPEGARDFLVPARLTPGRVLRAAAVAAAVQAAADDERLRALLPDRPLLPRRGPARRPPARVHAARPRDGLRRGGGRPRHDRGPADAGLRGRRASRRRPRRGRGWATTRRCCASAPTSRTRASRWRSPTSARRSRTPSSGSSRACSRAAASCAASTPAPREASRAVADQLTEVVKRYGAGGLVWAVVQEDGTWRSPAAKALSDDDRAKHRARAAGQARRPAADRRRREPDRRRRVAGRAAARGRAPLRPDPRGPPRAAVGRRLPDVRVEPERAALGRAAPPVHGAAGLLRGPGRAALARVRHRARTARRSAAGRSVSTAPRSSSRSSPRSGSPRRRPTRASGSCWRR